MGSTETQAATPEFRYIPLSYNHADSQASALRLILTLNPDWEGPGNNIEFVRFTDGITNTVCLSFFSQCRFPRDQQQGHQNPIVTNSFLAPESYQPETRPDGGTNRQ